MALIQRYSAEYSAYAGRSHDQNTAIAQIVNDVATSKRQDEDEKLYFHSLNDRLEGLLGDLNGLESVNRRLREELNFLITNWGIGGDHRLRFLQELNLLTQQLSTQNLSKVVAQGETRIFEELTRLTDRVTSVSRDVYNIYDEKNSILFDLIKQLENELHKIQLRWNISNTQLISHDDDYRKELTKFRSYLSEWSQISLEKQNLLNEIQTLREHYNLRSAFNQEEMNEWKRLLTRMTQDSNSYYRDYLETMKQQIQIDYEQMAKEQQDDVEMELKTRLREIQERIQMGLPINENDARRRREETQRYESRLTEQTREYDRLQSNYRTLTEEIQRKRRILQDLEIEARAKARTQVEQRVRLEQDTDFTREEYYQLKDELDKLAYTLRFSIEEELKIYEALLNTLERNKTTRPIVDQSSSQEQAKTIVTRTAETDDSAKYGIAQAMLGQNQTTTTTTTTKTTKRAANENEGQQQQQQISTRRNRTEKEISEYEDKYMQSRLRITRRYKGNILIKFVDVNGRFVEIENTGHQARDLTGWSIERVIDGRRINYTFPMFELGSHKTVRIYGNYHQRSSGVKDDDSDSQLIATDFRDWSRGQEMNTELFNRDGINKASFEQTIIQD